MIIKYARHYGEAPDVSFAHEYDTDWDFDDLDYIGDEIGENYWQHYDGWECQWPLTFRIWDKNDKFIGDVSVDVEMRPEFYSEKL